MDGSKMYRIEIPNDTTNVGISDEVIAKIAAIAAMETEGVDSLAGNITRDIVAKLSRKKLVSGVSVSVSEKVVNIAVNIIVKYGYDIPEVAGNVLERIKMMIETMTGFEIENIKVRISNVTSCEA